MLKFFLPILSLYLDFDTNVLSIEDIETFFAWWKRHLKVYHLISRSPHGLMIQMLVGLITYRLLAIYCYEGYGESVSIKRVQQLRNKIHNESRTAELHDSDMESQGNASTQQTYASP